MTAKELAARLDGSEYDALISNSQREEIRLAKENGLVVVYGASDDLMEIEGAIEYEADVLGGGKVRLSKTGVMQAPDCDPEFRNCPYYAATREMCKTIRAIWRPDGTDFAWIYETDIPHEVFRVLEDGEHYCIGIVFSLEDLK